MRARALPVVVTLAVACGAELPSPARVDRLRVLALTTPTPAVRPGASARVTAVWSSPPGRAPVRFVWKLCLEAPDGDARACALPSAGVELARGADDAVDIPGERLALPAGASTARYVVYAALCEGAEPVFSPSRGHHACPGGDVVEAVRRITVAAEGPLNRNPAIARAWLGGGPSPGADAAVLGATPVERPRCAAAPCAAVGFWLQPEAGASEALPDGGRETLLASFYATDGAVDRPRDVTDPSGATPERALSVRWTPPATAPGASVRVWAVLRDLRGGERVVEGVVVLR